MDVDFPVNQSSIIYPKQSNLEYQPIFIPIQEGCDKFCTFCVAPYPSGAEYSRPAADRFTRKAKPSDDPWN